MSIRTWISLITLAFLGLIVYGARNEIAHALHLLRYVDMEILWLLIPFQLLSYLMAGEMMFSYLRAKKAINEVPLMSQGRMALEMNFVNHVLPSAGVSGMSYMTWRMGKYGVTPGRATLAQLIRFVIGFASFATLLLVSLLIITIDGHINRWIIFVSAVMIIGMFAASAAGIFLISGERRYRRFSQWVSRTINTIVRTITFGKHKRILQLQTVVDFFEEINKDYRIILREKKLLRGPYVWGLAFNVFEVLLFMTAFWALGASVNPAAVLIAYGLASGASFFVATPGGAGAYEVVMAAFLVAAGVDNKVAIAGTVLTRVILLLGTIIVGYVFYQDALVRYGKTKTKV